MRAIPSRDLVAPRAENRIITPASPEFPTCLPLMASDAVWASGTWFSANDPIALPFVLPHGGVVKQLGWVNGSSAGGNVDIGIYSTSWARLVSSGSTLASGNSVWQWVDVTDTELAPGRYYLANARDNTTANRAALMSLGASVLDLSGCKTTTTDSFPLPDPLSGMTTPTATSVPLIGIAFRAPFA